MTAKAETGVLTQMMDQAREELLQTRQYNAEFSARQVEQLARAALSMPTEVTSLGMVTVNITGGEKEPQNTRAVLSISDLEAKVKRIPVKLRSMQIEVGNKAGSNQEEKKLYVLRITTNPEKIMFKDAAGELERVIGGERINTQFQQVFATELSKGQNPLDLKNAIYGLSLTANNTLRVSIVLP